MRKFDGFSLGEMMMEFYLSRMISHDIARIFFFCFPIISITLFPPLHIDNCCFIYSELLEQYYLTFLLHNYKL